MDGWESLIIIYNVYVCRWPDQFGFGTNDLTPFVETYVNFYSVESECFNRKMGALVGRIC